MRTRTHRELRDLGVERRTIASALERVHQSPNRKSEACVLLLAPETDATQPARLALETLPNPPLIAPLTPAKQPEDTPVSIVRAVVDALRQTIPGRDRSQLTELIVHAASRLEVLLPAPDEPERAFDAAAKLLAARLAAFDPDIERGIARVIARAWRPEWHDPIVRWMRGEPLTEGERDIVGARTRSTSIGSSLQMLDTIGRLARLRTPLALVLDRLERVPAIDPNAFRQLYIVLGRVLDYVPNYLIALSCREDIWRREFEPCLQTREARRLAAATVSVAANAVDPVADALSPAETHAEPASAPSEAPPPASQEQTLAPADTVQPTPETSIPSDVPTGAAPVREPISNATAAPPNVVPRETSAPPRVAPTTLPQPDPIIGLWNDALLETELPPTPPREEAIDGAIGEVLGALGSTEVAGGVTILSQRPVPPGRRPLTRLIELSDRESRTHWRAGLAITYASGRTLLFELQRLERCRVAGMFDILVLCMMGGSHALPREGKQLYMRMRTQGMQTAVIKEQALRTLEALRRLLVRAHAGELRLEGETLEPTELVDRLMATGCLNQAPVLSALTKVPFRHG